MMHHPSFFVPDLDGAQEWIERVFARPGTSIAVVLDNVRAIPSWPRNYSVYTPIADVFFDTVEPRRFVIDGVPKYDPVDTPHLRDFGFSVEGIVPAYRAIRRLGYRMANSVGDIGEGDEPPPGPNDPSPFFTLREETGLRYQFYPAGDFPVDPRAQPGWTLPPVSDDDPLAIVRCSHHTVLTDRLERAEQLFDALGAVVVDRGRNDALGATRVLMHLAGSTLEFATPDAGTPAHEDWTSNLPLDTYHAITWQVADLDKVERHLLANGVALRTREQDLIVTDPRTSIGIPWGFTTSLQPGDPRADA
jgi:hypothetical protein